MADDITQNDNLNIDLALEMMKRKLDNQSTSHNALEAKIGNLLGFVGVIAASAIVLLQDRTGSLGINIFSIGLIGVYLALIFLVMSSHTRIFYDAPDFSDFYTSQSLNQKNIDCKNQIISNMKSSYEQNLKNQSRKSRYYNFAIYSFLISILFLFLGIIENK